MDVACERNRKRHWLGSCFDVVGEEEKMGRSEKEMQAVCKVDMDNLDIFMYQLKLKLNQHDHINFNETCFRLLLPLTTDRLTSTAPAQNVVKYRFPRQTNL